MKKSILLSAVCLLLLSGNVFAVVLGPAQPEGKGGDLSIGVGIWSYSAEWDGDARVDQTQAYAQLGYAFSDNFEIYLGGGGGDLDVEDFNDGYRPFGLAGIKWLFTDRSPVGFGIFAQGLYFDDYKGDGFVGDTVVPLEFTKSYQLDAGVSLQTVIEGAILYGGPMFFLREGDVELAGAKGSFEEQNNFGGFLGVRWATKQGITIDLETQYKTRLSFGGAIHFSF